MNRLHVSRKVERTLSGLMHAGKPGRMVAERANQLIQSMRTGALLRWNAAKRKCTFWGEKRIRNCRKFDLGSGYRLITIQRGTTIYVPFLGHHDESQRWLETNSRLNELVEGEGTIYRIEPDDRAPNDAYGENSAFADAENDDFIDHVSDEELREVFRGLIEAQKK